MTKEEQLLATTSCNMLEAEMVDIAVHDINAEVIIGLEEEIKV